MNEARNKWKEKPTESLDSESGMEFKAATEPDLLAQALERAECTDRLRKTLRRIPSIYRRILVDHFVRGESIKTISRTHRIPAGTVLSRIFTAKRLLRAAWVV
jgi:DNA-directed RNA polymerase specialized sigma24 family protein